MKNKEFFTVHYENNDISLKVKDFLTNEVALPMTAGQYLYVGYYKPFRSFFIHFSELNVEAAQLTIEYYNGDAWVELPNVVDETENFIKSGFIYFERPEKWAELEVNGETNFYVRISSDTDLTAATKLKGLNILLSNDEDLIGIRSNIVSKHNNGNSWVEKHEAARKHIIQQLRNLGHIKIKQNDVSPLFNLDEQKDSVFYTDLTAFDLLEPFELREASKFYALSMIYLDELSDEEDDKWFVQGQRHEKRADQSLNVFMLKIDKDDDGVEDIEESKGDTGINLSWE